MPMRPINPFQDLVQSLFPEMAGSTMPQIPRRDPNAGPNPFQDGPGTESFNGILQGLLEQPGAARSVDGLTTPLTRGQKLMPSQQGWDPTRGLFDVVPNFGEDRDPRDPMAINPLKTPMRPAPLPDPELGQSLPVGFRMYGPGVGNASSGKQGWHPEGKNDNTGAGSILSKPAGNDNSPAPIPLFPAAYNPAENPANARADAMMENGGAGPSEVTVKSKPAGSPRDVLVNAIIGAESGGNPNAKNPKSSATGLGQFITGTWNATMRKHPELGLTPNGRTDPAQARKALYALTADNEAALKTAGIAITPGSLYAAHFLGSGGAVQALRNPDNARMADVVGPGVVKANSFLAKMTVGDFKAWSEKKMTGKGRGSSGSGGMPGAGAGEPGGFSNPGAGEGGGGKGNYTAGLTPDEQQGRAKGGGGVGAEQSEQAGPGQIVQDSGNEFLPYLQEIAARRAASKQKRSNRRSYIETLLGDNRNPR